MDAVEMRRLAAKKKRAEVRQKVNRKRLRKEARKEADYMEDTKESEIKKKDTIWKIIMPDKRREHATDSERRLVEEVEAMIE